MIDAPKPVTEVDTNKLREIAAELEDSQQGDRPPIVADAAFGLISAAEAIDQLRQWEPIIAQARKDMRRTVDVLTTTADALAHEVLGKYHKSQPSPSSSLLFSALMASLGEVTARRERGEREQAEQKQDVIAEPAAQ